MSGPNGNSELVALSTLPARFSYSDLAPEAADIARTAAISIRTTMAGSLREIGTHLSQVKAALGHGNFTAWMETELGFTDRTARNYMQVADFLEGKPEIISVLPATTLYALSAPTAPEEVKQSVVAAAEAGEPLGAKIINMRLDAAKHEAREMKAAQRRTPGISREKLKANKTKQQRRQKAEQERWREERAREEQEAQNRMRPLAAAIFGCSGDVAAKLLAVLASYGSDQQALKTLLDAGLRELAQ